MVGVGQIGQDVGNAMPTHCMSANGRDRYSAGMDATEIREALEEFVEEALKDDAGVVTDAKLEMDWAGGPRGQLIGPIPEGQSEPDGGLRTRMIDMTLKFGSLTPRREVARAVAELESAFEHDTSAGGRLDTGGVRLDDSQVRDDDSGDWLATVTVAVTTIE
jgi:hypothetical protein